MKVCPEMGNAKSADLIRKRMTSLNDRRSNVKDRCFFPALFGISDRHMRICESRQHMNGIQIFENRKFRNEAETTSIETRYEACIQQALRI